MASAQQAAAATGLPRAFADVAELIASHEVDIVAVTVKVPWRDREGWRGLLWEINGTDGDVQVSAPSGHTQMVHLSLKGARGEEKAFRPQEVPASYRCGWPEDVVPGNVARLYARMAEDLRESTRSAPSFDDAVAVHRVIAAIERAAESGSRIAPASP